MSLSLYNCGCAETTGSSATVSTSLSNDSYLTLGSVSVGKVLVIPEEGKTQKYLQAVDGDNVLFSGMMVTEDGINFEVTTAPQFALPIWNPAVASVYPTPAGVQFLFGADTATDSPWKMIAAPTNGEFYLRVKDGKFVLLPIEGVPGIAEIVAANTYVNEGALLSPFTDEDEMVTLRKLYAEQNRVITGREDGEGNRYFKSLGIAEYLDHPLMRATTLNTEKYQQLIPGTHNVQEDGLPYVINEITDNYPVGYSPTGRRFFISNPRTIESVSSATNVIVDDDGNWQSMGVHCNFPNISLSTKNIFVSTTIKLLNGADDYSDIDFGLFIDNTLVYTWDVKGGADTNLTRLQKGLTLGEHDIEIRFKQLSTAGQTQVLQSNSELFCL